MNPFLTPFDLQRRTSELATEFLDTAAIAPEQIDKIANADVGHTPSTTVYSENKLELLHYEPLTDEQYDIPILITFALINRPYILDLQPDRSVVRRLLEAGLDVYLIDWDEPSLLDGSLGLEDYVVRYMDNCVDVVRERSAQDAINLFGYCMGGTMSAMYAALFPEKVRTLGLMAAGLCFQGDGGVLELWGSEEYYSPETLADSFGTIPASFFDLGFSLMDPVQNNITKYAYLYDNLDDDDFVENFARMEKWLADGIGMAGHTYEQFLGGIYQDNLLYENALYVGGRHIDLANITMPVLQIVGEYDHLIPPETSTPFNDVIASDDTTVLRNKSGHIGLSVSSRAHDTLWPEAAAWFVDRSAPRDPIDRLQEIDGIGPVYAQRLVDAGVTDVETLTDADPGALATDLDVTETQVQSWQTAAREHTT